MRRSRSTFSNGLSRPDPFECGRAGPGGTLSTVSFDPQRKVEGVEIGSYHTGCFWISFRKWEKRGIGKRGATILLSSHNMAEVERIGDLVVIMSYGRLAEMGGPGELIERHRFADLHEVLIKIVVTARASARRRIVEAVFHELVEGARP